MHQLSTFFWTRPTKLFAKSFKNLLRNKVCPCLWPLPELISQNLSGIEGKFGDSFYHSRHAAQASCTNACGSGIYFRFLGSNYHPEITWDFWSKIPVGSPDFQWRLTCCLGIMVVYPSLLLLLFPQPTIHDQLQESSQFSVTIYISQLQKKTKTYKNYIQRKVFV